jgi:hypothetical protein
MEVGDLIADSNSDNFGSICDERKTIEDNDSQKEGGGSLSSMKNIFGLKNKKLVNKT